MKTLNNKRASVTKTYLLFTLLAIAVIGIVWAQAVPTQYSHSYVQGTQLMLEKRLSDGTLGVSKPYTIRGVTWGQAAGVTEESVAGPGYCIHTTAGMQYASVANNPKWNLPGAFTIAVWVNMSSYSPAWWEGAFMAHDEGGGGLPKWIFSYDQSGVLIWHLNGPSYGGATLTAPAPLDIGKWYLVGISRDATNTYKFWVNGEQKGPDQVNAAQIEAANCPLTIGFGEGCTMALNDPEKYCKISPLKFNRALDEWR